MLFLVKNKDNVEKLDAFRVEWHSILFSYIYNGFHNLIHSKVHHEFEMRAQYLTIFWSLEESNNFSYK